MTSHINPMPSLSTLGNLLTLNFFEEQKIKEIKLNTESFISQLKYDFPTLMHVMKLSVNKQIHDECAKDCYNTMWGEWYELFAYELCEGKQKFNLHQHKHNNFNLLKGAYYFWHSQQIKHNMGSDFSNAEKRCLVYACELNSIHAIQRYAEYVYQELNNNKLAYDDQIDMLKTLFKYTKQMWKAYGAYAYLMSAEACCRLALLTKTESWKKSAIQCCIIAEKNITDYPKESEACIHNASLGQGLALSNSFKLDSPSKASKLINELWTLMVKEERNTSSFQPVLSPPGM